jgi:flagellar biosynthesis chaperone FliJ
VEHLFTVGVCLHNNSESQKLYNNQQQTNKHYFNKMKFAFAIALFAILAVVSCATNPYAFANTLSAGTFAATLSQASSLQLADTYNWAFAVTSQVKIQIKALQDAIDALKAAVDSATVSRDAAEQQWQVARQKQSVAQAKRDAAKNVRDSAQSAFDNAQAALAEANGALDNAVSSLQQNSGDYEKLYGAFKAASNIRDVEKAFKLSEVEEFCKIISLIGAQHGLSKYCGPNGPIQVPSAESADTRVSVNIDNHGSVLLNGVYQFETSDNWGETASGNFVAKRGDVIAINADNFDGEGTGNPGAIIADVTFGSQSVPTSERWRCVEGIFAPKSAAEIETWPYAVTLGNNGVGPWGYVGELSSTSSWIWVAQNYVPFQKITCAIAL